ncbi:MAG TPA: hypothetical protein VG322_13505 [Candidatus Acidoferrales bacterium]|nr:hypothetical protein [Candidatus Acidoferrales bacterium]
MPDETKLATLHKQCLETLHDYMREANKMCSLLESIHDFPLTVKEQIALTTQRQAEYVAHQAYHQVRKRLFERLKEI